MAKMDKSGFKTKIDEKLKDLDIDVLTEILEDIEDSWLEGDTSELDNKISELEATIADLKMKYKNRFLGTAEITEEKKDEEGLTEEEKEYVDVKELDINLKED